MIATPQYDEQGACEGIRLVCACGRDMESKVDEKNPALIYTWCAVCHEDAMRVMPERSARHGWKETYGPWIHCKCGWKNHSLFDSWNNRQLRRHIESERVS